MGFQYVFVDLDMDSSSVIKTNNPEMAWLTPYFAKLFYGKRITSSH
jgi:hypothetical protein